MRLRTRRSVPYDLPAPPQPVSRWWRRAALITWGLLLARCAAEQVDQDVARLEALDQKNVENERRLGTVVCNDAIRRLGARRLGDEQAQHLGLDRIQLTAHVQHPQYHSVTCTTQFGKLLYLTPKTTE